MSAEPNEPPSDPLTDPLDPLTDRLSRELEATGRTSGLVHFTQALSFAAFHHREQRRKDPAQTPYINHPIALVHCLLVEAGITDEQVLIAALLHDTVEDTEATFADLHQAFGLEIMAIVREVTDDKTLAKADRKQNQITDAPHKSHQAKQVKLADKICNLRDLQTAPPIDWSLDRQRDYFHWAREVVEALGPVHPELDRLFAEAYTSGMARLDRWWQATQPSPPPAPIATPDRRNPPQPRSKIRQIHGERFGLSAPGRTTRLYLAGPLFSAAEQAFNRSLADQLRARGYEVFLPQAVCAGLTDPAAIFRTCKGGLEQAQVVLAVLDGADADSGTCWECGYAAARQIPIVALRTDFRESGDTKGFNAMLYFSATAIVTGVDVGAGVAADVSADFASDFASDLAWVDRIVEAIEQQSIQNTRD